MADAQSAPSDRNDFIPRHDPECRKWVISMHARANVVRTLNPQPRKDAPKTGTAASCQQETHAPQQTASLFDHLVRA